MIDKRLAILINNGAWQFLPAASSMLLSIVVVINFSDAVWGQIVPYIIWQQMVVTVLAWGNKDYLQLYLANAPSNIKSSFSRLFVQRGAMLLLTCAGLILLDYFEYNWLFILLVIGRFLQQSFDFWLLKSRRFIPVVGFDAAVLALQVSLIFFASTFFDILLIIALGFLVKGLFLASIHRSCFVAWRGGLSPLLRSSRFALINIAALLSTRLDLIILMEALKVSDSFIGRYQLIMAFLWNIRAIAHYVASPYIPLFYRMSNVLRLKMAVTLAKLGLIFIPILVFALAIIMFFVLDENISGSFISVSMIFCFLPFVISLPIYELYKQRKQMSVLGVLILTMGLSAFGLIAFSDYATQAVVNVLIILTITRIAMGSIYYLLSRNYRLEKV